MRHLETIREFIQLYVWKKAYTDAIIYSHGTFIGPNISSEFLHCSPVSTPGPHWHNLSSCLKKLFLLVPPVHCFCTHFYKVTLFCFRKKWRCWCISRGHIARSRFPPRGCSHITTRTLWKQCKLKGMGMCYGHFFVLFSLFLPVDIILYIDFILIICFSPVTYNFSGTIKQGILSLLTKGRQMIQSHLAH